MRRFFIYCIFIMICSLTFIMASSSGYSAETQKKSAAVKKKKTKSIKKTKKLSAKKIVKHRTPVAIKTGPALVTEMRYWSNPDYTRIAVTLDHESTFEHHLLKQQKEAGTPERLYIDIPGAHIAAGVKDIPIGDGLLKMARIAQYQQDVARVVIDIDNMKDYKIFPLSDPFRIIIDARGERKTEIAAPTESITAAPSIAVGQEKVPAVRDKKDEVKFKPGAVRRIVVDPGHGGKDPGAVGANGTMEKDVVLSIGLKLAEKLRKQLGLDVIMTRSSDVFIPLEERTAIANKVNADLFVSVHANASLNRSAVGMETYYLNLAKTEKAAQLAARENGTSLEKVSLLQAILFDLMAHYKLNDSAHLAEEVQKAIVKRVNSSYPGAKNLGVKQGPFYVLVGATMPSILVETAFISNATEEAHLKDPVFQETAADGILDGIKAYVVNVKKAN